MIRKIKKLLFSDLPQEVHVYPVIKFLCSLSGGLILPLLIIYYRVLGLTLLQIGIVSMIFELSMAIFEIPTGFIADKFGRRKSIIASLSFFVLTGFIYLLAKDLKLILVAVILRGIGYTLMSGAFEAWAYDKLKHLGKEQHSQDMFVISSRLRRLAIVIGSLAGSALGLQKIKTVWFIFIFINVISLLIVLMSMKESYIKKLNKQTHKHSLNTIVNSNINNAVILVVLMFLIAAIYEFALSPISEYWSVFLIENKHLSENYLGSIIVISNILIVFALKPVHKIIKIIDNSLTSLVILHLFIIISIVSLAITNSVLFAVISYICYTFFVGVSEPLTRDYLNCLISSEYRATLLSIYAMAGSIGEVISAVAVGLIAELYGIRIAFITSSVAISLVVILFFVMKAKSKNNGVQKIQLTNHEI